MTEAASAAPPIASPVASPVAEALRAELLKLATDGDPKQDGALTAEVLAKVVRVAKTGRDLLMSLSNPGNLGGLLKRPNSPFLSYGGQSSGEEGLDGSGSLGMGPVYSPSPPSENFGMVAIREIVAAAKEMNKSRNAASPVDLVEALALARDEGLTDVAKELEAQLGIGKKEIVLPSQIPAPVPLDLTKFETAISATEGLTKTVLQEQKVQEQKTEETKP